MPNQPAGDPPIKEASQSLEDAQEKAQRLIDKLQHLAHHVNAQATYPTEEGGSANVKEYLEYLIRTIQSAVKYGTSAKSILPTVEGAEKRLATLGTVVDLKPKY